MTVASLAMSLAKDDLRQQMRSARLALSAAKAAKSADSATRRLSELPQLALARTVAIYAPVRGEIDTQPLASLLRSRGAIVVYPRMAKDSRLLSFCASQGDDLVQNSLGIPEPPAAARPVVLSDIDVFVVPGLAFDDAGDRLGWGRGYYDTTLRTAPHALRVGFLYDFQRVATVPADADDECVDTLVTEINVLVTHARPARPPRRNSQ